MKKIKIKFKNFYLFSVPVDFDLGPLKILFSNHLVVQLECGGKKGIGEGVLYQTSLPEAVMLLKNDLSLFFKQEFLSFKKAKEKLNKKFFHCPGICCAFDLALWDLEGKIKRRPVYELIGSKKRNRVEAIEQLFIPQNKISLIKELNKIISRKTKNIKLKTGRNLNRDLENISLIQYAVERKLGLQVDLNQSLNLNQAISFGKKLKSLRVDAWEEPIKGDFNQLKKLKMKARIPLILDESILNRDDLEKAIKCRVIDILNVKFSRLGGLTPSLQLIKLAQKHKVQVEIGCSEELGLGTQAQMHLACYLKQIRGVEGLGSSRLELDLIKDSHKIQNGFLKAPLKKPGWGIKFSPRCLKAAGLKKNFQVWEKKFNPDFNFYFRYTQKRLKSKLINGLILLKKRSV